MRNSARLPKAALWLNLPPGLPGELLSDARLFCQQRSDWSQLQARGFKPEFGAFPASAEPAPEAVVLTLPREKARLRMLLAAAASLLSPTGELFLAGELRSGIRSAPPHVLECFGKVGKLDGARHSVLLRATQPRSQPFDPEAWRSDWTFRYAGQELNLASWPGVFAHASLDAGTQLLLGQLPELKVGSRVLDLGCGAGVLGLALLLKQPDLELVFSDDSALACLASITNLQRLGLQAQVVPSDGFAELEGQFDLVISNPPFHTGSRADLELARRIFQPVRNFLRPRGQLLLVANRHLPYQRWLDELLGEHRVVASDGRYHVLAAQASASPVRSAKVTKAPRRQGRD